MDCLIWAGMGTFARNEHWPPLIQIFGHVDGGSECPFAWISFCAESPGLMLIVNKSLCCHGALTALSPWGFTL